MSFTVSLQKKIFIVNRALQIDRASQMKKCFPFPAESKISSDGDDTLNNDDLHSSLLARRELRVHVLSSFTTLKAHKSLSSLFKRSPPFGVI